MHNFLPLLFLLAGITVPLVLSAQWTPIPTTIQGDVNDLYFVNANLGFAVGSGGIYRSVNGGNDWTRYEATGDSLEVVVYNNTHFKAVFFCPAICQAGYAVGRDTVLHQGVVFQTNDNGLTWQLLPIVNNPPSSWNDLVIVNNTIFLGGDGGRFIIKHPFNPGWTEAFAPPQGDIQSVWFSGASPTGFIGTNQGFFMSSDIGESWIPVQSEPTHDLVANFSKAFGIGDHRMAVNPSANNPAGWSTAFTLPDSVRGRRLVIRNFNINDVSLATDRGVYKRISDEVWELQPSSREYDLKAIFFVNANLGFAAGNSNIVLKTENGGGSTLPYTDYRYTTSGCVGDSVVFYNQGYAQNSFRWVVDDSLISTDHDSITLVFDTAGIYTIRLEADNGFFTNTFTDTIHISNFPDNQLAFIAITDTLCMGDSTQIVLQESESGMVYSLENLSTQESFPSQTGVGDALLLATGPLNQSALFIIHAQNPLSGCQITLADTAEIHTVIPPIGMHFVQGPICPGDSIQLTAQSGLAYEWRPANMFSDPFNAHPTVQLEATTTFTALVTPAYCPPVVDTVVINVFEVTDPTIDQNGDTLFAIHPDAAYYSWYINGDTIADAHSDRLVITEDGLYQIMITDNNGCQAISSVVMGTAVFTPVESSLVKIFPNPTRGAFQLQCGDPSQIIKHWYVVDVLGNMHLPSEKLNLGGYWVVVIFANKVEVLPFEVIP